VPPVPVAAEPEANAPAARPVPAPAPAGASTATPTPSVPAKREKVGPTQLNVEEFKNDPLIQKALEIFKGRIIEVRA